ncbi:MAG: hypothetical protein K9J12_09280 [Melioribacteraceae bacterium]|nr:hypothetical protein [Melioribacteraceae bacterium]MCF8264996.1 hypothetical protein [Melioribacteraceae bacterium]MCF8414260.1 hypothetical protein [Melioribacteraceae bacterium]MCF8432459.1 hypothetical protein [Melioribacteraceae bacterium]
MIRFIVIIILFCSFIVSSQNLPGARQIGLSHSGLAQADDVFTLFSNPGGLSQLNWREVGVYYSPAPFGLSELANAYGAYHENTKFGSFAAGFKTYGFELYKENQIILGYSNYLGNGVFAGISLKYNFLKIQNYGNTSAFTILIGSVFHYSENISFAIAIDNLTRSGYSKEDYLPVVYSSGISYEPLEALSVNFTLEKDLDHDVSFNYGTEYSPLKYFTFRVGFSSEPKSYSGGIGINYSIFQVDYSVFQHIELGLTHQAGVLVHFEEFDFRSTATKNRSQF